MRGAKISPKITLPKPVATATAIGSGGLFGEEGPIIMTGGAAGSLLARGSERSQFLNDYGVRARVVSRYTCLVSAFHNAIRESKARMLFGILLCSLVFVFSTSAKLAAYNHAPAAAQIKSMKMPLKSLPSITDAAAAVSVSLPVALLVALLGVAVSCVTLPVRSDETLPTRDRWFSLTLAVRPPPSI